MSYNKSKLQKEYKKVFNSSQRKDSEVIHGDQSLLSLNNRLVWIPGKPNSFKHNNINSNKIEINNSSTRSTQYMKTTDNNLNNNALKTTNTYTIINISFNGSSQEKVPLNSLAATRQVIVLDRPQKKIKTKKNNCYLKKSKHNTDDCSLAVKNEKDVISVTDQCKKSLDDCSLTDCIEDVIQKEKCDDINYTKNIVQKKSNYNTNNCSLAIKTKQDVISVTNQCSKSLDNCSITDFIENVIENEKNNEFAIGFLNNQQKFEIKTISI